MKAARYLIEQIDTALWMWEDACFCGYVEAKAAIGSGGTTQTPLVGPVIHASEFRQSLLRIRQDGFDEQRFVGPPEVFYYLLSNWLLPKAIAEWTTESRRVFYLTEDMQIMLQSTSFGGVRWCDIQLPFKAFLVTLENPIAVDEGLTFNCLLVCQTENQNGRRFIEIRVFNRDIDKYSPIHSLDRHRAKKYLRQKKWTKAAKIVHDHLTRFHGMYPDSVFYLAVPSSGIVKLDDMIKSPWDRIVGTPASSIRYPECNVAAHIVFGLCIYLDGLVAQDGGASHWQPQNSSHDDRAITDKSQVCTVSSLYEISDEERKIFGGPRLNSQQCAHFRRAHWRKPPGQGADPNAKKSIRVKMARIRFDRLREGELPGGSEATVK